MKFKAPIEVQSGISDGDPTNPLGVAGYLLSSDGSNVSWVSPGELSAETAEAVVQPIKANEALTKGDPLYIVGYQTGQDVNTVGKADSNNPSKMPAVGIADADYSNQAFGTMTAFGSFNGNFDTTGGTENWSIGDIIFVKSGGGLTNVKPGGTKLIQNIAIVSRVQQNTGELEVIALGRTNDVPNLPEGRLFVGTAANTSKTSDVVYVDDTNDRVGIGTASPSQTLQVNADVTPTLGLYSDFNFGLNRNWAIETNGFGTGNWGGIAIKTSSGPLLTPGLTRLGIDSSGNVGINTTSPDYKLEVNGTLGVSRTNGIIFAGSAGVGTGSKIVSNTSNDLIFNTAVVSSPYNTTERVRILNNGNVGIGTNSPAVKLHVGTTSSSGSTTEEFRIESGTSSGFGGTAKLWLKNGQYGVSTIGLGPDTGGGSPSTYILYDSFGSKFYITTNSSTRIYIDNSGNVSIGGTSTSYKLDVLGDGRFTDGTHGTVHLGNYGQNISSNYGYIQTSNSLRVNGSVKVSDDTTSPSSSYVGSIRYRTSGNNSYVDMMMQTGASTYAWVNIVTNSW